MVSMNVRSFRNADLLVGDLIVPMVLIHISGLWSVTRCQDSLEHSVRVALSGIVDIGVVQ